MRPIILLKWPIACFLWFIQSVKASEVSQSIGRSVTTTSPDFVSASHKSGHCPSVVLPLINHDDTQYSVELLIGNPQKKVNLLIDTGSSTTWIFAGQQRDDLLYTQSSWVSSSMKKTSTHVIMTYGSGRVSGIFATDEFGLLARGEICDFDACSNNISLGLHAFVLVHDAELSGGFSADGLLALGITESSSMDINTKSSLFTEAFESNKLNSTPSACPESEFTKFSISLRRNEDTQKSAIIFGASLPEVYGASNKFNYFPVISQRYWAIGITDMMIGGKSAFGNGEGIKIHATALVDTGTSFLAMPFKRAMIILDHISKKGQCYIIDSSKNKYITAPQTKEFVSPRTLMEHDERYLRSEQYSSGQRGSFGLTQVSPHTSRLIQTFHNVFEKFMDVFGSMMTAPFTSKRENSVEKSSRNSEAALLSPYMLACDCGTNYERANDFPDLSFKLSSSISPTSKSDEYTMTLRSNEYMLQTSLDGWTEVCIPSITPLYQPMAHLISSENESIILGDTFLRSFYVEFDGKNKRVGLMPANNMTNVKVHMGVSKYSTCNWLIWGFMWMGIAAFFYGIVDYSLNICLFKPRSRNYLKLRARFVPLQFCNIISSRNFNVGMEEKSRVVNRV